MKKFYSFFSIALLVVILTNSSFAGDENPNQVLGQAEWMDYLRLSISDYVIFDGYSYLELTHPNCKQINEAKSYINGRNCIVTYDLTTKGEINRMYYHYSDETGYYESFNTLCLDLSLSPCQFADELHWLKSIDYQNQSWTMFDSTYDDSKIGPSIYFNGNLKIEGKFGKDSIIYVGSTKYECKTVIYTCAINGTFRNGNEKYERNNYKITNISNYGKKAGAIGSYFHKTSIVVPGIFESVNTWTAVFKTIYRQEPTSVKDQLLLENEITISPNPFSSSTVINYQLPAAGNVKLDIYNSLGSKITTLVDEFQEAGSHRATFEAGNLSKGLYYYIIHIGERMESGKLLLYK
jgi:hypothetical protein